MAPFDLTLASIAENLQAVRNVFPKEQAERIEKWILKCVDTEDFGKYALSEIKKYDEMFQKSLNETNNKTSVFNHTNPLDIISVCLLNKWLGKELRNFETEIGGKKTGVISPVLVSMTSHILINFVINWKKIKEDFDLVVDDIPLDEDLSGLKDYVPEVDEQKPDGTIRYYDENGNLKEKWLPPEQIKELLKIGSAKRLYKVLIKGPWNGIKEAWWELSEEIKIKFIDEKDYAYAIAHYEKGKLKYHFISKRLWEKQEQLEKIFMDQSLSPEQQKEVAKRLIGMNEPITILGEKLDEKNYPVLYKWAKENLATLEQQLSGLAKLPGGSVIGAMQNLETDLQHQS